MPCNQVKHLIEGDPLGIGHALSRFLHCQLCPLLYLSGSGHSLLCQTQSGTVAVSVLHLPENQAFPFQFCHSTGNGRLILVTDGTKAGRGNALRIAIHCQQALGVGALQPVLCHLHPLDLLDAAVNAGNRCGKLFKSRCH